MQLFSGIKGFIVEILSENHPLTVPQLMNLILKRFDEKVSRQAIHLALRCLKQEMFVDKTKDGYELSLRFMRELESFLNKVKAEYLRPAPGAVALAEGKTRKQEAHSLMELDAMWNAQIQQILSLYPEKAPAYIQQVPHAWFAIAQFEEEAQIVKLLMSQCRSFYTLVSNSTPLDRWLARFYTKSHSRYALTKVQDLKFPNRQLSVLGEYIIEADYPPFLVQQLNRLFGSCSQLADLDLQSFLGCVNAVEKITLKLSRNKIRAQQLERSILAHFK